MRTVLLLLLAVFAGPQALAESVTSGSEKSPASARINFRIVIPKSIALRVDTKSVVTSTSGQAMTKPSVAPAVRLQSNMRPLILSQSPGFITVSSP